MAQLSAAWVKRWTRDYTLLHSSARPASRARRSDVEALIVRVRTRLVLFCAAAACAAAFTARATVPHRSALEAACGSPSPGWSMDTCAAFCAALNGAQRRGARRDRRAGRGAPGRCPSRTGCPPPLGFADVGEMLERTARRGGRVHQHVRSPAGRRGRRAPAGGGDDGEAAGGERRRRRTDPAGGGQRRHPGHRELRDDLVPGPGARWTSSRSARAGATSGRWSRWTATRAEGDRRRAGVPRLADRPGEERRRCALRFRLLRRQSHDVADGQRAATRGHRHDSSSSRPCTPASMMRRRSSSSTPKRAGDHPGLLELAIQPEGLRGVRRARLCHQHRRRGPARASAGTERGHAHAGRPPARRARRRVLSCRRSARTREDCPGARRSRTTSWLRRSSRQRASPPRPDGP